MTCPANATAVAVLQGFLAAANRARACLQGVINKATGEAQLQFIANFMFSASKLYKVSAQVHASLQDSWHIILSTCTCG